MGTVENIVTTLTKMGHDKRGQASQRYNELSAWLSHEISLIRSLVESSPRNSSYGTASEGKSGGSSKGKGKMSIKTTSTTENSSKSTASSFSGNKSSKDTEKEKFQRQKRKSPETRQTGAYSESPDLKRNSLDYEELAVEAGLPADLNRLRKDQLINELEKRGCTNFTMKSLKKELIDGLRSALADCNRGEVDTSNTLVSQENISGTEKNNEPPASPEAVPPPVPEPEITGASNTSLSPNDPPPVQTSMRSSLMSSMRSSVGKLTQPQSPEENSEQLQEKAANEFEARQNRSLQRKSVAEAEETLVRASVPSVPVETTEISEDIDVADMNSGISEKQEESQDAENFEDVGKFSSPEKVSTQVSHANDIKTAAPQSFPEPSTPSPNKEIQMDIASPRPVDASSFPANEKNAVKAAVNSSPATQDGPNSRISAISESSVESSIIAKNPDTQHESVNTITASAPVVETKAPVASGVEQPRKPTNLVSSQTSFLPGSKPKPVIPALQQAARVKEAEAAKALQREAERKRKEQEARDRSARPAVPQTASVHGSKPMSNLSKPNVLKHAAVGGVSKPMQSNSISTSKSNVAAAVKSKGGIMGFIKKTFTTPGKEKAPKTPDVAETTTVKDVKESPNVAPVATTTSATTQQPVSAPTITAAVPATAHSGASGPIVSAAPVQAPVQAPVSAPGTAPGSQKKVAIQAAPVEVEYEIEDRSSSGSDDSGTDDEREDRRKNTIPDWARGAQLKEALERQFGFNGHTPLDPDVIFYEVQTCSLEEIFGQKEGKSGRAYAGRSSSAKWDADEISVIERRKYRQQMGYAATTPIH